MGGISLVSCNCNFAKSRMKSSYMYENLKETVNGNKDECLTI